MDAALAMEKQRHPKKEMVPAGIFYYHIDDPVIERQEELSKEEIEAQILKKLRMNGLVNSSLDVIRHMDREITKESDVIPVALKDGLIQESKSSVAGGKRFANLSGFVNESLKKMGEEILDGKVSVNPYKQGKRTACDYCPYHGICGFDMKTSGYGYRRFRPMKAEEIWEKIDPAEEEGEEENG
jgi:ATP-dependent helicase/nuclease subunit B